jgi:hypothetical protein
MKIKDDVKELLKNCRGDGEAVFIGIQMDKADYSKLNEVLEAAGGKWNRTKKAHIFPGKDAAQVLAELIDADKVITKGDIDAFFTPPEVIERMAEHIIIKPGMMGLEPSAGIGNIAKFMVERGVTVDCVESHEPYYKELVASNLYRTVLWGDFLKVPTDLNPRYDLIMMNPPFSLQADIDHVLHAMKFLPPGGQLVSVMSPSFNFRMNRKSHVFREVIDKNQGIIEKLPAGSFKKSGTNIESITVTLTRSNAPVDIFDVNSWRK